jgi:hypothetical protein
MTTTANLSTLQKKTVAQAEALGLEVTLVDQFGVVLVQVASKGVSEVWITSRERVGQRRANKVQRYTFGQFDSMKASDISETLERWAKLN